MRLAINDLEIRHPIGHSLPGVYVDHDELMLAFVAALDEVWAPMLLTVDNLLAWFDPVLTPADALPWLASWVGIELDEEWTVERQRASIINAAVLFRERGTVGGLRDEISLLFGVEPEIIESGGVAWSDRPGDDLPGDAPPRVTVRVAVQDPDSVDRPRLERIVRDAIPVSLPFTVEIVDSGRRSRPAEPEGRAT